MLCRRQRDQDLLSTWLDSLDLSSRFHLDVFSLIERYCFVNCLWFVNTLAFQMQGLDRWFRSDRQFFDLKHRSVCKGPALDFFEFFGLSFGNVITTCGTISECGHNYLKTCFNVWSKYGDVELPIAIHGHKDGRAEIITSDPRSMIVCGGWDPWDGIHGRTARRTARRTAEVVCFCFWACCLFCF